MGIWGAYSKCFHVPLHFIVVVFSASILLGIIFYRGCSLLSSFIVMNHLCHALPCSLSKVVNAFYPLGVSLCILSCVHD